MRGNMAQQLKNDAQTNHDAVLSSLGMRARPLCRTKQDTLSRVLLADPVSRSAADAQHTRHEAGGCSATLENYVISKTVGLCKAAGISRPRPHNKNRCKDRPTAGGGCSGFMKSETTPTPGISTLRGACHISVLSTPAAPSGRREQNTRKILARILSSKIAAGEPAKVRARRAARKSLSRARFQRSHRAGAKFGKVWPTCGRVRPMSG